MIFEQFISHLETRCEQIGLFENAIRERVKEIEVNKGQVLLFPGEVCKYAYFIHSGFFRLYQNMQEQEVTVDFAGEMKFITSLASFFNQRKSNEGLICETKAIVLRISYHDWLSLEDVSDVFLILGKNILQEYLILSNQDNNVFRISNATQKYLYLCKRYPQLTNSTSQKHIASYLGITEQRMSLIRKCLLREG